MGKHPLIYLLLIVVTLSACQRNYEELPLNYTTQNINYAFDSTDPNGTQAELYLVGIYANMPLGYNRIGGAMSANTFAVNDGNNGPLDAATDDALPTVRFSTLDNLSTSGYTATNNPDDAWANSYAGIRKTNIFLANYNRVPWAVSNKRLWYGAESRFLRAFFYFELIKRYGGVPLLGDKILELEDNLDLSRNTYEECVNYVVAELDSVKDKLRPDPLTGVDVGRISKGAAYALKAKVLLYAASPLNNTNNDLNKWKAAADAAKAVMSLGTFALDANVNTAFTTLASRENIFYRMNGATATNMTNGLEYALSPVGYTVASTQCNGLVSPSQELVDAFGMANGKAITDATSGYNAASPYAGRDPRLATTVFFNGQSWTSIRSVETFVEGRDNLSSQPVKTRTGYYQRKFLNNTTGASFTNVYRPWPYIRYAEILLDFAEARNEYSGPDAEVYTALRQIRTRAGITAAGDYGLPAGATQAQMRTLIRNERRVELAFEEQRYWDVRRWKIAESVYAAGISGMNIVKNTNGSFTYTKVPVATPAFQARMYLYPIPYNQVIISSKLVQNPGW